MTDILSVLEFEKALIMECRQNGIAAPLQKATTLFEENMQLRLANTLLLLEIKRLKRSSFEDIK
jgi:hypothetical protein